MYTAIIKRTSNYADSDEDTILYYNIDSPVYRFSKEHALYGLFKKIEQKLAGVEQWEEKNDEIMRRLERELDRLERDISQDKRAKKEWLQKINDIHIIMETAEEKDHPYYLKLIEELRKDTQQITFNLEKNQGTFHEKQQQFEMLKEEKEMLLNQ